ncbi:hypothetical protein FA15DRAFT_708870 [Coprinopsis marcescibilis]|uniref:DUF6533 domain-containing protein n=1 Tax=Coprinopsis marcescibilis TaxID=230819 RepID=A0A5C3KI41_COPMA|nr:hypothetical protein FA15DRAFT_708870 [Coprinopsis marcescibilis]
MADVEELKQLALAMTELAWSRYTINGMTVASVTIFLYDYFHTFEQEVETMWKGKFNLGKFLFFMSRYVTFIDMALYGCSISAIGLSQQSCASLMISMNVIALAVIAASEVISLYALLGAKRKHAIFLSLIYGPLTLAAFVIVSLFLSRIEVQESPLPTKIICLFMFEEINYVYAGYCILILGELLLTATALLLGFRKYRNSNSSLVQTLYRDGSLYYLALLSSPFSTLWHPLFSTDLFSSLQRVMHPILANRVLLNMRHKPTEPTIILSELQWNKPAGPTSTIGSTTLDMSEKSTIDHESSFQSFPTTNQV